MSEPVIPPNVVDVTVYDDPITTIQVLDAGPAVVEVDVSDVGMRGPTGPEGPTGPTGPTGPAGPSIANSGMPPRDTDGAAGALWVGTGDPTLYGPKVTTESSIQQSITHSNVNTGTFELGHVISVYTNGIVSALWFYRSPNATMTTRTLRLWQVLPGGGVEVAQVVTTGETGSGWKRYPLATPLPILSGDYTVSYSVDADSYAYAPGSAFPMGTGNVVARLPVATASLGTFPAGNSNLNYLVDMEFTGSTTQTLSLRSEYGELPASYTASTGEYGVQFKVRATCYLTAIKWYRPPGANLTSRTLRLFAPAGGAALTTVTTTNESGVGWQKATLPTPYKLDANTQYVVSTGTSDTSAPNISSTARRPAGEPNAALQYLYGKNNPTAGNAPSAWVITDYWVDVEVSYVDPWPVVTGAKPSKVDVYKGRVLSPSVIDTWTWSKPAGARLIQVVLQGAGGGGGAGRRGATNTVRGGGSGGGGGMRRVAWFAAEDLPEQVTVAVATAGKGAAAVTVDSTDGADGGVAGSAEFRFPTNAATAYAFGGGSGIGGKVNGASGSGGPLGVSGSVATSSTGGAGAASQSNISDASQAGGGGGGITTANAYSNGGNAYAGQFTNAEYRVVNGGAADGASGTEPVMEEFPYGWYPWGFGAAGGGGASSVAGPGGKGSNGKRGGGGGGGGASTNGQPSGAGGDGGAGYVMVITYF